jgi:hypothetical protein
MARYLARTCLHLSENGLDVSLMLRYFAVKVANVHQRILPEQLRRVVSAHSRWHVFFRGGSTIECSEVRILRLYAVFELSLR